jgi:hypothetical protein
MAELSAKIKLTWRTICGLRNDGGNLMWWYFVKLGEDSTSYRYAYGFESRETTGEFEYDKASNTITIIKRAKNQREGKAWTDSLARAAYQAIEQQNAPETWMIAYG